MEGFKEIDGPARPDPFLAVWAGSETVSETDKDDN